jgi:aspartyl/glutamyl-tRNA(Asn/Gln) amidotransferase C subunit
MVQSFYMASAEDVQKLAALARLSLPEEHLSIFAKAFDGILAYVGKLDELSLPASSKRPVPAVRNVMREDGEPHANGAYTKTLTAQFPNKQGDSLKVKQILSHD